MRVNRWFRAITEHRTFDKILFRTDALKPENSIDLVNLQINPVFKKIVYDCQLFSRRARFLFKDKIPGGGTVHRELALANSSAANQNATEPGITHLHVRPFAGAGVVLERASALTVQDVMDALCEYWESPHYVFRGLFISKRSSETKLILLAYSE
jgi:hypothetical protein